MHSLTNIAVLDVFFTAYTSPVALNGHPAPQRSVPPQLLQERILPQVLAASKSTNALTRSSAALFFNTLVMPFAGTDGSVALLQSLTNEIGAPLKTNKTASPEQRVALCQMLDSLEKASKGSIAILNEIVACICASLAKETNEPALKASLQTLTDAAKILILQDVDCSKTAGSLLAKGMSDAKANVRRQYLGAAGDLMWTLAGNRLDAEHAPAKSLAQALLPGLETALKSAAAGAVGSAVEGWIAVSVLCGPAAAWFPSKLSAASQSTLSGLLAGGAKPSFLLAEKGYRKLTNADDEVWLVRALESVLTSDVNARKVAEDRTLHTAVAQPLLQVALDSQHHAHRDQARQAVRNLQIKHSDGTLTPVFTNGLEAWLQAAEKLDALKATTEEVITPDRPARIRGLLSSVSAGGKQHPGSLCQVLVISHHVLATIKGTPLWVDLVLKTGQDPKEVASENSDELLSAVSQGTAHSAASMRAAAFESIATLAFIAPDTFLPLFVSRIRSVLAVDNFAFIGNNEMGIYGTAEGQPFIDGM